MKIKLFPRNHPRLGYQSISLRKSAIIVLRILASVVAGETMQVKDYSKFD